MPSKKQEIIVRIRKLRVNYELRYDYLKVLSEYIKRFPKEHRKTRKDSIIGLDGKPKDDWVRVVSDAKIGEVIFFLIDNKIKFVFENITKDVVESLQKQYVERQKKIANIIKLKADTLDVSDMDFSFLKFPPYEYQKKAVKFFELNKGLSILGDQPGVGKSQDLNSLISTPNGWIKMGNIKIGQIIFEEGGGTQQVTGIFPQGMQDTYSVTFSDNTSVKCNMEHLWKVKDTSIQKNDSKWTVKTLKELTEIGLYYKNKKQKTTLRWEIPLTNPVQYKQKKFDINPYDFGNVLSTQQTSNDINHKEKTIPKNYLKGSVDQRFELLRGLMDTSGDILNNKTFYCTTSQSLSHNIAELVQSLGGIAEIKTHNNSNKTKYQIIIKLDNCPFLLSDKKSEWLSKKHNKTTKYIKSVKYLKTEPHQCISVSSKKKTYITDNYTVTHNTLPAFAYAVKNNLKTLVVCPATLKLMWKKEIEKFTNKKAFIYKFKPKKRSKFIAYTKEESDFHIINYEAIESYIKLEYKHKCHGKIIAQKGKKKCNWTETSLTKSYKTCPVCENTGTIKSRISGLVGFQDEYGIELIPEDYNLIVIDECHRIKESKTTWTKIIHKAFKNIPKKILLSGTVIKSKPMEFFSSLSFVDPKEWKNYHEFGIRYCAGYQSGFGWDYSGASNLVELFQRVSPIFLRRLKKDVLEELPEKTYIEIPIELTKQEYKEYQKIEKEMKKEIVDGVEVEKSKTFLEKIHKIKLYTGKIKLNRVKEIIEDVISTGEKVVVMSDYQQIAEELYEYFGDKAVLHTGSMDDEEKQESVDKFQEDKNIKVFSGMVMASGVGITLTAASKLYRIGFAWTPADMEQGEDRIHRASATSDKIEIITLICQDTIDVDIDELLKEKAYIVTKTLDNQEYKKNATVYNESIYKELIRRMQEA